MWWLFWVVICIVFIDRIINRNFYLTLKQGPSPPALPIIGHILLFTTLPSAKEQFELLLHLSKKYKRLFILRFLTKVAVILYHYKDVEVLLSSNDHIEKGESYDYTIPWVGRGLLTSDGEKWRSHRKMITPAFHFKILNAFLEIFHRNGNIMCDLLEKEVDKGPINVYKYINLMALDNIYESAMGVNAKVQQQGNQSYVQAVKNICTIINARAFSFPLRMNWVFRMSKFWEKSENALKILHATTEDLINKRKIELRNSKEEVNQNSEDNSLYSGKTKQAFLDKLLTLESENKLTFEEVREEVDTFMFEGHDTISSGLSFAIYALATHSEIQQRVYTEQKEIFGDSERLPTMSDLQNMQYLDRVIKEAQRLYPSVPIIERRPQQELHLPDGKILPKNTGITILIHALHRDPEIWPNPDTFDPDNFLPEAVQQRNPYCYVPFSAGPRNCIGQRFAMMEMKTTISKIIRRFELQPSPLKEHKLALIAELVLISASGFHVQLKRRSN